MNIKLEELESIKDKLEGLDEEDIIVVEENGEKLYAIMKYSLFEAFENYVDSENKVSPVEVKFMGNMRQPTYEEYETIKGKVDELIDKVFKPKPENLN